jgi:UDP-glucose 4-epimerase
VVIATNRHYLVIGGLGFIGSNFVERLLLLGHKVTVIDDMSNGKINFISSLISNERLKIIQDNVLNWENHVSALVNVDSLIHLASNADISASIGDPTLDFNHGTVLTQSVAELVRINRIKTILYASGSGVYGDYGKELLTEGLNELIPISTYGASKVAGEALLCAYSKMFKIKVICFRFANVVGPNQTHGVGLDFLMKLKRNPFSLQILGDGEQKKSYIHVSDVIDAVMLSESKVKDDFQIFNISSNGSLSVKMIAKMAIKQIGLDHPVFFSYTGGDRGWKGDVPVVRLNVKKIRKLGWRPKLNSKQAMEKALESIWDQIEKI